jgi:hypothetical protein
MKNENLLDTSNGHCYVYTLEEIKVEVLGGIRIDILDRLRVTLKISKGEQSIRHNLDLYNDSQVDRLIRKAAERLEIGSIPAQQRLQTFDNQAFGYSTNKKGDFK